MGTFADSLFTVLMSWVRGLVNSLWALVSSDHTTLLEFLGKNWLMIAVVIIAAGLAIDWIIWLLRWQPYHLWAQRARRVLRIEDPDDETQETPQRARAAAMPERREYAYAEEEYEQETDLPRIAEEEERSVLEHAQNVPDEYAYPGMRYDSTAAEDMGSTQRYGAVTQEGPGAAEVARRKAEIEAWQMQMQEEARARAEAERREREAEQVRLAQEAYEAEQARLAQEAYEAEQARLAQQAYEAEQARLAQEAYEAEQARLAQEEYQRQLAEYERQKAQYELDLAEYERQKAEYEAQLARSTAAQQETAQELAPGASRRRRSAKKTYSDYIEGDAVADLPDAPEWPDVPVQTDAAAPQEKKPSSGLISRMAKMMDPEDEELVTRTKLPPRVNMQDAYKPAVSPAKSGRRSRRG